MDPIVVSKIGVGISTINIHLPQFKIQGYLQNEDSNAGVSKQISMKKKSKFCTISVAIFFIKIL